MALVRARCPDVVLLVVGTGPGLSELQARVAREGIAGHVVLAGRVAHNDVPAHLAAMDLTVAPYVAQDGFYFSPLKVVESLAAGRPVVAPRLGQLTSLIHEGVTGLLYSPGDQESFADCVSGLLLDRPRRLAMGLQAVAAARTNFGWDRIARHVAALVADVVVMCRSSHLEEATDYAATTHSEGSVRIRPRCGLLLRVASAQSRC